MQFRTVLRPPKYKPDFISGVIGKGTFDYSQQVEQSSIDFVIPLSSLKGNKLPLGNYQERTMIGYVHESFWRNAKTGWMFMQHFKWETLEADGIIQKMIDRCTELRDAYNSVVALSKILTIDYADRKENRENYSEEDEKNLEEYEDNFIKIVECDRENFSITHTFWKILNSVSENSGLI